MTRHPFRRLRVAALAAAATLAAIAPAAHANDPFPSKPIRIIVSQSPGGQGDRFVRAISQTLGEQLKTPIVVDNRTGGNGVIAANLCKSATPDGYTLCVFWSDPMVSNPALFKNLSYDPNADFQPITPLFFSTLVLASTPELGVKNVREMIELSKKKPLDYAAPSYSVSITFMEKLKRETGADVTYIPYKGGSDVAMSMLQGITPVGVISMSNLISYIREGKVLALAVDSEKRSPLFPNVPTMAESGVGFDKSRAFRTWFGLFAPANTPNEVTQKIYAAVRATLTSTEIVQRQYVANGLEDIDYAPAAFTKYIRDDQVRAKAQIEAAGVKPQ